jgi:hypothetical protein
MSVQVKRRREAASFLSSFAGAAAELIVDTTNNRVQVHDGATPGGWPAAKLAETQTIGRTIVADANYAANAADVSICVTRLTATRTIALPISSTFPVGRALRVLDETGLASSSLQIVVAAQSGEFVDGAASVAIASARGVVELVSNGAGKWFRLQDALAFLGNVAALGIGTPTDPGNPLSATLNSVLFNALATTWGGAGDVRVKLNKQSAGNTASFLFQDAWSGRAEVGLCGDDSFHFKVSPDGSSWSEGLVVTNAGFVGVGTTAPAARLDVAGPLRPGVYALASLPTGVVGAQAFVSNGRKIGEAAGAGTGVLAVFSNSAWRRLSDDTPVLA